MFLPRLAGLTLIIVSVFFLSRQIYFYAEAQTFLAKAELTEGKIVRIIETIKRNKSHDTYHYKPVVEFVDTTGQTFQRVGTTSKKTSFQIGRFIPLAYDKRYPGAARLVDGLGFFVVSPVSLHIGFISLVFALFINGKDYLRHRNLTRLKTTGKRVKSTLDSIKIEGRKSKSYRILSQWVDDETETSYLFESHKLMFNPKRWLEGEKIPVHLAPSNPRDYVVDLSFYPIG